MISPSSHPNACLTHTRIYTRRLTTIEAIVVKMSAEIRNVVPLFCLRSVGSCDIPLMLGAQLSLRCIDELSLSR